MAAKKKRMFSPARLLLGSILLAIGIGTILLSMPFAQTTDIPFLDVFFTAASATTVTGLETVPIEHFSNFGHFILMCLIQIGGLGLITMTLFLVSLFVDLGFSTQLLMGQIMELDAWKNIKKLLLFIIGFTLAVEAIGAFLVFFAIRHYHPLGKAIFIAIFHSISSFCNAGFTLFPHGQSFLKHNGPLLGFTSFLILAGGLGFITWNEIIKWVRSLRKKRRYAFTLHSKIVLYTTGLLIGSGTLLFWILERNNTLQNVSWPLAMFNSLFNALAARSAGLGSVPVVQLHLATILIFMILAFIGSSPGSTGSGVKTTTFVIFLSTVRSAIYARPSIEIQGRRIARDQVYKALAIITLSIAWIFFATFCLLITETGWEFLDILFEVVSAFATMGLSLGVTPYLTTFGKGLIIITMIVGRIGSLTAILALQRKIEPGEYEYPEERVMLS